AINACPAGEVVQLAAGNFTFTEGNFIELANGITVRGAGAGTTILGRNGDGAQLQPGQSNGSNAQPMIILGPMQWGTQWNIDGTNSPSPTINLTADAVQHQSTITLKCGGNCASILSVGQIVLLDEVSNGGWQTDPTGASSQVWAAPDWTVVWNKHNPSLGQDDFSSSQYPYTPGTYGDGYARLDRPTNELKQIASISG